MFFKSYPFSKSTTLIAFFMILSASFTRQLMELMTFFVGKQGFKIFIITILVESAIVFFIAEIKRLRHFLRIFAMVALLFFVFLFIWKIELPQVRMHILMYAVVGWLASRDATKSGRIWSAIMVAWLFAAGAGILEELFQKLLPYRVFEIQDIIFNIEGATLGVILYLMRPVNVLVTVETQG